MDYLFNVLIEVSFFVNRNNEDPFSFIQETEDYNGSSAISLIDFYTGKYITF